MGNLHTVLADAKNRLSDHLRYENRDAEFLMEKVLGRKLNFAYNIELTDAEIFEFETMKEKLLNHKNKRKELTNQLKDIIAQSFNFFNF